MIEPKVCLITFCWNEEDILPYFLNHYKFCEKIIVYDNESTDNSIDIMKSHSNVEIRNRVTDNRINDIELRELKNNAWKEYRDQFDWIIVCDCDELLYAPNDDLKIELFDYKECGISICSTVGYTMAQDTFPYYSDNEGGSLTDVAKLGYQTNNYGKCIIFNPKKIQEINYMIGGHKCSPIGDICLGWTSLYLLHYRYFGYDYWMKRNDMLISREGSDGYSQAYRLWKEKVHNEEDYKREFMYDKRMQIVK